MLVAAGPYTTCEDLTYAPLRELLGTCQQLQPNVLVLLGPFVDAEHPLIVSGSCEEPFEALFASQVGTEVLHSQLVC